VSQASEESRLRFPTKDVLRTIFQFEKDKLTGGWSQLYKESFHNWYSSQNATDVIKSGWWTGRDM
jgi:hypothetical protein